MARSLLLTGHPGIGKTTIIEHVIHILGNQAGGFYTREISGPGGRKGFRLLTLDGKETVLAHKDLRSPRYPTVGRYGVDVEALERVGVAALHAAMDQDRIIIVDEIGKMELYSQTFQETLMRAIIGPHHVVGTVMLKPHPGAAIFKMLAQVTVWEVERRNRDAMVGRVLKWIRELHRT